MIALLFGVLRTRRGQALTVFLLSAVAIAAAAAGPVAFRAVEQAVVRNEVAAAAPAERTVSASALIDPSDRAAVAAANGVAAQLDLDGFDSIYSGELVTFGPVPEGEATKTTGMTRLVFREQVCAHLTILSGRCLAGAPEVVIGDATAAEYGLSAGDTAVMQWGSYNKGSGQTEPTGPEVRVTIAGIYRPTDPTEPYWATRYYFTIRPDGTRSQAVFASLATLDLIPHDGGVSMIDVIAPDSALTLDRLSGIQAELDEATETLANVDRDTLQVSTELPMLAQRVAQGRAAAADLVPVAFVPLVAIAFFVIYLAVGQGVAGRRQELGLVSLRGIKPLRRWWLATGETVVVIFLGAPLGYVLGYWAVHAVAAWRVGGDEGTSLDAAGLPYATAALFGALLVALLGQRRSLTEPVVDLLRGVTRGAAKWQAVLAEMLVGALAIVAIVQLRLEGLGGVSLLVPGLVVTAVALLAARGLGPAAGTLARTALRHGHLGTGLSAVQLARRPGSQRLFVLVSVAVAMLGFVAAGYDVGTRAREDRAIAMAGAQREVTVEPIDARSLLRVTRGVDPEGAWAMAVVRVEQSGGLGPPVLALDSSRLGNVAIWREEFGSPQEMTAALSPPPPQVPTFSGNQVSVDIDNRSGPNAAPALVVLSFARLDGGAQTRVSLSNIGPGRAVRTVAVGGCQDGCRLTAITVRPGPGRDPAMLVVRSIKDGSGASVVEPAELLQADRWHPVGAMTVLPDKDGALFVLRPGGFDSNYATLAGVDVDLPVPVVASGSTGSHYLGSRMAITGLDGQQITVSVRQAAELLPRLGLDGVMADLDYLDRASVTAVWSGSAEVWLGPAAPADAPEQLRAAGLPVTSVRENVDIQARLAQQGPAMAMQFHLAAAVLCVLLALGGLVLVAMVDRRARSEDLRALRNQGMPRRFVRRAALGSYLSIVVVSGVVGLLAAAAAWWAAGDRLPTFTDAGVGLSPPRWPRPEAVLVPWSVALGTMLVVAFVAAVALWRAANSPNGNAPKGKG